MPQLIPLPTPIITSYYLCLTVCIVKLSHPSKTAKKNTARSLNWVAEDKGSAIEITYASSHGALPRIFCLIHSTRMLGDRVMLTSRLPCKLSAQGLGNKSL